MTDNSLKLCPSCAQLRKEISKLEEGLAKTEGAWRDQRELVDRLASQLANQGWKR